MGWQVKEMATGLELTHKTGRVELSRTGCGLAWPESGNKGVLIAAGQTSGERPVAWVMDIWEADGTDGLVHGLAWLKARYGLRSIYHPPVDPWIFQDVMLSAAKLDMIWIPAPDTDPGWSMDLTVQALNTGGLKVYRRLAGLAGQLERLRLSAGLDDFGQVKDDLMQGKMPETAALATILTAWRVWPLETKLDLPRFVPDDSWTGI